MLSLFQQLKERVMSLDVYLERKVMLSYDEGKTWTTQDETVYSANITHNLGKMAREAGLYMALWCPDQIEACRAIDIINVLEIGLHSLKSSPEKYRRYDSDNGWGVYSDFVPFVEDYLLACKEYPEAAIHISK